MASPTRAQIQQEYCFNVSYNQESGLANRSANNGQVVKQMTEEGWARIAMARATHASYLVFSSSQLLPYGKMWAQCPRSSRFSRVEGSPDFLCVKYINF